MAPLRLGKKRRESKPEQEYDPEDFISPLVAPMPVAPQLLHERRGARTKNHAKARYHNAVALDDEEQSAPNNSDDLMEVELKEQLVHTIRITDYEDLLIRYSQSEKELNDIQTRTTKLEEIVQSLRHHIYVIYRQDMQGVWTDLTAVKRDVQEAIRRAETQALKETEGEIPHLVNMKNTMKVTFDDGRGLQGTNLDPEMEKVKEGSEFQKRPMETGVARKVQESAELLLLAGITADQVDFCESVELEENPKRSFVSEEFPNRTEVPKAVACSAEGEDNVRELEYIQVPDGGQVQVCASTGFPENLGSGFCTLESASLMDLQQDALVTKAKGESGAIRSHSLDAATQVDLGVFLRVEENPGFYSDAALNPMDLQQAVRSVKTTVGKFAKQFSNSFKIPENAGLLHLIKSWYADVFFAREQHVAIYAVKAAINDGLFKDFEKDDFADGITQYFDQNTRSEMCQEYFLRHKKPLTDDLFSAFRQKKFCWLVKRFKLPFDSRGMKAVEAMRIQGGSQLASDFNAAVTSIWLLHKVAFAFKTPARIFRVNATSQLNLEYMEPVEVDQQFVARVGFMIMPGFRLGNSVIKAEIYTTDVQTADVCAETNSCR